MSAARPSYLLPLLALVVLTVILVPPSGDFPLNDDWVYAAMAKTLVEQHEFVPHIYRAAYAVFQTFWGAAFCAVFGFSYTVLRVSTIALALAAIWLTARCAREVGATRSVALLCGATLFANPLFLNLSYTFMTEVPYIAPMMASGYFYLRALRRGTAADTLLGSAFAVVAFSNRQYGVLSTAAFIGALVVAYRRPLFRPRPAQAAALLGPWLLVAAVYAALNASPDSPLQRIGLAGNVSAAKQIGIALNVFFSFLLYVGLFLFPVAVVVFLRVMTKRLRWRWSQWTWFALIAVCYTLLIEIGVHPLPRLPNLLRDFGIGPLTLYETTYVDKEWSPVSLPAGVWRGITIAAGIAAGAVVAQGFGKLTSRTGKRKRRTHPVRRAQYWFLFLWAGMLLFSPLNPALTVYFDRYLLPGTIPVLLLVCARLALRARAARAAAAACVVTMYAASLAGLQDYLAWNRARWEAISILRSKYGAADEQIDGGYEFNGVYTSETYRALHPEKPITHTGDRPWWIIDEVYAVSFLPREGYTELERVPYRSWLLSGRGHLNILKRQADAPEPSR